MASSSSQVDYVVLPTRPQDVFFMCDAIEVLCNGGFDDDGKFTSFTTSYSLAKLMRSNNYSSTVHKTTWKTLKAFTQFLVKEKLVEAQPFSTRGNMQFLRKFPALDKTLQTLRELRATLPQPPPKTHTYHQPLPPMPSIPSRAQGGGTWGPGINRHGLGYVQPPAAPGPAPAPPPVLLECPVCSLKFSADTINQHLDGCLQAQEEASRPAGPAAVDLTHDQPDTDTDSQAHQHQRPSSSFVTTSMQVQAQVQPQTMTATETHKRSRSESEIAGSIASFFGPFRGKEMEKEKEKEMDPMAQLFKKPKLAVAAAVAVEQVPIDCVKCPYENCRAFILIDSFVIHVMTEHITEVQTRICPLCAKSGPDITLGETAHTRFQNNLLDHLLQVHTPSSHLHSGGGGSSGNGGGATTPQSLTQGHPTTAQSKRCVRQTLTEQDVQARRLAAASGGGGGESKEDESCCLICYEEWEVGMVCVRLPCMCLFHQSCISSWKARDEKNTCPFHITTEFLL